MSRKLPGRTSVVVLLLLLAAALAAPAAAPAATLPDPLADLELPVADPEGDGEQPAPAAEQPAAEAEEPAVDAPADPAEEDGQEVAESSDRACEGADARPTRRRLARARSAVLCLLNRERARRGLPSFRSNAQLLRAAERHSRDMVRRRFFSHTSPAGASAADRIMRTGYASRRTWAIAENIAWGAAGRSTPASIVEAWMNSTGHRANILNRRYRDVGVGIVVGAPVRLSGGMRGATYTLDFGFKS